VVSDKAVFCHPIYSHCTLMDLRKSGYGIYVGNIFTGCILYADDIILLSCSYYGMQKMVNICTAYGIQWDKFNSIKSQCVTFGGSHSSDFTVLLTGSMGRQNKIPRLLL